MLLSSRMCRVDCNPFKAGHLLLLRGTNASCQLQHALALFVKLAVQFSELACARARLRVSALRRRYGTSTWLRADYRGSLRWFNLLIAEGAILHWTGLELRPIFFLWARRWVYYWICDACASATPDLRLPSQRQSILQEPLISYYSGWT